MPPGKDQEPTQSDVLADHQPEFGNFRRAEMLAEFCPEGGIRRAKVQRHFFGEANRQRVPGFEAAFGLRKVNLRDGFLVESLTRRRRVACEESGIALVECGDFQPSQFLDARGDHALIMPLCEESEEALEMIGDELQKIHGLPFIEFSPLSESRGLGDPPRGQSFSGR
jgi:hypothetical protein